MKKIILALIIPFSLHAQSDSLKVTFSEEKVEQFEKTTLLNDYENAFGRISEVKSGLRFRIVFNPITENIIVPQFQFEQKVFKNNTITLKYGSGNSMNTNLGFEFRRYNIDKNPKVFNSTISGDYISFFVDKNAQILSFSEFGGSNLIFKNRKDFFYGLASVGISKGKQFGNILNFGFKGGFKFGKESQVNNQSRWVYLSNSKTEFTPFISSFTEVGLGLLFPIKNKFGKVYNNLISTKENIKDMWRLNLSNLLYIDKYKLNFEADISYERKIKESSFSWVSNLKTSLGYQHEFVGISEKDTIVKNYTNNETKYTIIDYENNVMRVNEGMLTYNQQFRYFPGMKKRVLKGKSGNNLYGFFVGIFGEVSVLTRYFNKESYSQMQGFDDFASQKSYGLAWGYQQKLSKNTFISFDYNFGLKSYTKNYLRPFLAFYQTDSEFQSVFFSGSIKLGLAK